MKHFFIYFERLGHIHENKAFFVCFPNTHTQHFRENCVSEY